MLWNNNLYRKADFLTGTIMRYTLIFFTLTFLLMLSACQRFTVDLSEAKEPQDRPAYSVQVDPNRSPAKAGSEL